MSRVSRVLFAHLPRDYPAENSIYYDETLRSSGIGLLCTYRGLEACQQGAQAVNQAAQQATRGAEQGAQEGAVAAQRVATKVSIEDYDDLNVAEIVEQLDNLSVGELQRVRAYEQQNKDRDTLLEQIERKINAAS